MTWQQLKVNVKAEFAEKTGDLLTEFGAQAVTFVDARDTPVYEPKPGEILLWPDTRVIGLFAASDDLKAVINCIYDEFKNDVELSVDQLEDKDWEREWMDNFHPMKFGQRLWICPSWREIPNPDDINILLDPGLAFGTGTHPTTSLCLEWLDSIDCKNKTVVDFGCGSGILGIAALKLGAKAVIGIDIDPQALQASRENAIRNQVEDKLSLFLPAQQPELQADIVIANILSAPLKELSGVISNYCCSNGYIVMSGILKEQTESVMMHYQKQFSFEEVAEKDNWVRLSAIKTN